MNRVLIGLVAAFAMLSVPVAAKERTTAPHPVAVMVLGMYHMGYPGKDLVNITADDVTKPRRQAEIQAVVDAIAKWRPTKVLVEVQQAPPFSLSFFRSMTLAQMAAVPNGARKHEQNAKLLSHLKIRQTNMDPKPLVQLLDWL